MITNIHVGGNDLLTQFNVREDVSIVEVTIVDNPNLEICCVIESGNITGSITLSGNLTSCNSLGRITQYCDPDGDDIDFPNDNCPFRANPSQDDADVDDVGNACIIVLSLQILTRLIPIIIIGDACKFLKLEKWNRRNVSTSSLQLQERSLPHSNTRGMIIKIVGAAMLQAAIIDEGGKIASLIFRIKSLVTSRHSREFKYWDR